MDSSSSFKETDGAFNPLDVVEDVFSGHDWRYMREGPDEIHLDLESKWVDYRFQFFWQQEYQIMHTVVVMDMRVLDETQKEVFELIANLNHRLYLGRYEYLEEHNAVAYRFSQYIKEKNHLTHQAVEDIIEMVVEETDRFYPAFQYVISGSKTAQEAMGMALLETIGEA